MSEETRCQLERLQKENKQLSEMVAVYSRDLQEYLEALETPSNASEEIMGQVSLMLRE
ncbi:unnamed protein product [Prunus armeniaca]